MLYKHESEISLGLSFPLTPRSGARKEMKIRFHTWRCPGIENPGEEKGATCVENCCLHSTSANVPLQGRCKRSRIAGMRFLRRSAARRQNLPAILLQDKILGTTLGSVVYYQLRWKPPSGQLNLIYLLSKYKPVSDPATESFLWRAVPVSPRIS